MPTFDVVSELDMQEVRNAVDQASREISTRYDFKNTGSSVELGEKTIELNTAYNQPANPTNPVMVTVYADPNTFVGGGSGVLGALDEIAFMAADTGDVAPSTEPAGVVHGSVLVPGRA